MSEIIADAVVVELEARLGGYNASVQGGATAFDTSMKKMTASAGTAERHITNSFNNTRISQQILQHVARSTADSFAAGTPAITILTTHLGQLAEAGAYAGGALGRFGSVLTGGWGIAISFGLSILGALAASHRSAGGAAGQQSDAEKDLTDVIREQGRAEESALNTTHDVIIAHQAATSAARERAVQEKAVADELERQAQQSVDQGPRGSSVGSLEARSGAIAAERGTREAQGRAEENLRRAGINAFEAVIEGIRERAEASVDPIRAANLAFDRYRRSLEGVATQAIAATRDQAAQARIAAALDVAERTLEQNRARILAGIQARLRAEHAGGTVTQFGSPLAGPLTVTSPYGHRRINGRDEDHPGVDLRAAVGTQALATAPGTIIYAGQMAGYGNVVIIDHGAGLTTRFGHLSQILQRSGHVDRGTVIGLTGGRPGDPGAGNSIAPHLHYEVRQGSRTLNPLTGRYNTDPLSAQRDADRQAREAETAAEQASREDQYFHDEKARLQQALLQAQRGQAQSAEQTEQLARDEVTNARDRKNADYQSLVQQHRLTDAHARILIADNNALATAQLATIERQKQVRLAREETAAAERVQRIDQADLNNQEDVLRGQADLANTAAERRTIELRLLDLQFQEERLRLQAVLDQAERVRVSQTATAEEKAAAATDAEIARRRLDILGSVEAQARGAASQRTAGPFEQYRREIHRTAAQLDEDMQRVEVSGLQGLNQGLVDAITGAKSLGDAFHDVANQIISDLLRIAIQELIIKPLSDRLLGSNGSGLLASLFGGRGDSFLPFGTNGFVGGAGGLPAFTGGFGRATGGTVVGGTVHLVGEHGPELFKAPASGYIVPNNRLAGPGAEASRVTILVRSGGEFEARVIGIAGNVAVETVRTAAPAIVDAAKNITLREAQRPRLNAG